MSRALLCVKRATERERDTVTEKESERERERERERGKYLRLDKGKLKRKYEIFSQAFPSLSEVMLGSFM